MVDYTREDAVATDRYNQLRPLDVKLSTSSTFHGSCVISLGNTVAKCLVNLPKVSARKASTDFGQFTLEMTSNDTLHTQKYLETLKTHIFETFENHIILSNYPCQIIEAYVIILNDDGSLLPTLMMGMCLALIDCGIHLYDIISACSVEEMYYKSLDQNLTAVTLGYCSQLKTIAFLHSKGRYLGESLKEALEVARVACNLISGELFKTLRSNHMWKEESSNFVLQTESIEPNININTIS